MLRTAERLAALDGPRSCCCWSRPTRTRSTSMEGEARLVVEAREGVRISGRPWRAGATAVIAETLRRLRGGIVICQFGGLVVPDEGDLRPLASALECPLFAGAVGTVRGCP